MSDEKNTAVKNNVKTSCCGTCDCNACSCGCPATGCACQESGCNCGCRTTDR